MEEKSKMKSKKSSKKLAEKSPKRWMRRSGFFAAGMVMALILVPLLIIAGVQWQYQDKVLPGVKVAGEEVGGMTRDELEQNLKDKVVEYKKNWPVIVGYEANQWQIWFNPEIFEYQIEETAKQALNLGKQGKLEEKIASQWDLWREGEDLLLGVDIDNTWLENLEASASAYINIEPVMPRIEVVEQATSAGLLVHQGEVGREFDNNTFSSEFKLSLASLKQPKVTLPVKQIEVRATNSEVEMAKNRAEKLLKKELVLEFEDEYEGQVWQLDETELISWVGFESEYEKKKITEYITEVAGVVDRPPQNARFAFNKDVNRVEEFVPAKDGLMVEVGTTTEKIVRALKMLEGADEVEPVVLSVSVASPEITMSDVNDLGVNELIGRGDSTYFGSIPGRVHNVSLAAKRITGALVGPGEEFSFNKFVGEISQQTGYESAYVIKNGRTELGDGGGVCQDSTTVFRAALDAGLPITSRKAHSYRVGYYEQNAKPGLDATVYSPSTDLKFLNDTPAHILIQAEADSANRALVVEIYGTSDGRASEIDNHVVWDVTPPLPDEYIDDPTLAAGVVKQIDWKSGGAKAKFDYTVTRDGEVIFEKNFYSAYRPWSAKFLRGPSEG